MLDEPREVSRIGAADVTVRVEQDRMADNIRRSAAVTNLGEFLRRSCHRATPSKNGE